MATSEIGTGRYGVEAVYKHNPKNSFLYWFDTEGQRNIKIKELTKDRTVKNIKKRTNNSLFGGSTMRKLKK